MARYYFEWIDDDGALFRRFTKVGPVEAWLVLRDLDDENLRVVHPIQFDSLTDLHGPVDVALRRAVEAANRLLQYVSENEKVESPADRWIT